MLCLLKWPTRDSWPIGERTFKVSLSELYHVGIVYHGSAFVFLCIIVIIFVMGMFGLNEGIFACADSVYDAV